MKCDGRKVQNKNNSTALKIGFISLGCAKNLINTEQMVATVIKAGYQFCDTPENSDVVVINTCGFIEAAKVEALDTIFEMVQLKKEKKIKAIIVAGCLSQRYKDEIESEIYEVDGFIGVGSFQYIAEAIQTVINDQKYTRFDSREQLQLEGERILSTPARYAYIKIADGCSNCCSYCAIPLIRGKFKSRKMEDILAEAKSLAKRGVRELIVVAQDTTNYGVDIYKKRMLAPLLTKLCEIEGIDWIRVMYLYPEKIDDQLISVIKNEPKILKYIEMPIQHADSGVLKAMRRKGDSHQLLQLIEKLRSQIKDVILRTTIMVGFPGEDNLAFLNLCEFLKQAQFDKLGVFAFSPEVGTAAYEFDNQVADEIKHSRAEAVEVLQSDIVYKKQQKLIGKTFDVLVEGYDQLVKMYFGRSYMEAPEIDGQIFFTGRGGYELGDIIPVTITETIDFDLLGEEAVIEHT